MKALSLDRPKSVRCGTAQNQMVVNGMFHGLRNQDRCSTAQFHMVVNEFGQSHSDCPLCSTAQN